MKKMTLKQLRKVASLTQEEASKELGVSHDTISRWESGATQPMALQVVDICRVYKCKFENISWSEGNK